MAHDFNSLISCRKVITKKPKRDFFTTETDKANLRNEFECLSEDGLYKFSVKMRKNLLMPNSFSVLLIYTPADTNVEIQLLRYNCSQEHRHRSTGEKFTDFHIHKNETLKANNKNMPAVPTKAYCNYETAYAALLKDCNILVSNDRVLENQIDMETLQREMAEKND